VPSATAQIFRSCGAFSSVSRSTVISVKILPLRRFCLAFTPPAGRGVAPAPAASCGCGPLRVCNPVPLRTPARLKFLPTLLASGEEGGEWERDWTRVMRIFRQCGRPKIMARAGATVPVRTNLKKRRWKHEKNVIFRVDASVFHSKKCNREHRAHWLFSATLCLCLRRAGAQPLHTPHPADADRSA
jgi:hypothetical protein